MARFVFAGHQVTRYVLLDRDGTLVRDSGYTHRVEDYQRLPGVVDGLRALRDAGYRFAIVTNQSGIGRGYYSEAQFEAFQRHLVADLAREGVVIDATFRCPHRPDQRCECRKPAPGLLEQASARLGFALRDAWLIGDTASDLGAARAAGCRGVLVLTGEGGAVGPGEAAGALRADDLVHASQLILETDACE